MKHLFPFCSLSVKMTKASCAGAAHQFTRRLLFFLIPVSTLFISASAHAQIIDDGSPHTVNYSGGAQDFVIPNNPSLVRISFTLNGGDGGYARVEDEIPVIGTDVVSFSNGGSGATATVSFAVGSGAGQIPHGSTVRFIVGGRGANGSSSGVLGIGLDYGGGGGGTAVLYQPPASSSWILLGVAGGGGGAYQGMVAYTSVDSESGQGGRSGTSGGSGNGDLDPGSGGTGGNGGDGNEIGGAGGGALTAGGGVTCIGIPDFNTSVAGEGGPGNSGGTYLGGYGGSSSGCFAGLTWRNGGYGFGGGGAGVGAGGGGGGYSGGGPGGTTGRGGGGGSYLDASGETPSITEGGSTASPENGFASYQVTLNPPPVAICQSISVDLLPDGTATITAAMINNGSYDPDGETLTYALDITSFNCSNVGANQVTLTVTDEIGLTDACTATVTVNDVTPPAVLTQNITVELDANGQATITPAMIDNGSTDACGISSYSLDITSFDCGDVGDNTVVLTVTDVNGNSASAPATVTVEDNIAPTIVSVTPNPATLWSPNHKMEDVVVTIESFDNCPGHTCEIISVTSNEPLNDIGDGNTDVDYVITGTHTVQLRAERNGKGVGRVYTITVECTDASGNTSQATTVVTVAHDQSITTSKSVTIEKPATTFSIEVMNNPSAAGLPYRVRILSKDKQALVQLRLLDAIGRPVEVRKGIHPEQVISIGQQYKAGVYFVEAMQNGQRKTLKLLKF